MIPFGLVSANRVLRHSERLSTRSEVADGRFFEIWSRLTASRLTASGLA